MKLAHVFAAAMAMACGISALGACQSIQGIGTLPSLDGGATGTDGGSSACTLKGTCTAFETTVPSTGQRACLPQGQCTPTDTSNYAPRWAAPLQRTESCTNAQIDNAFLLCLGSAAGDEEECNNWFADVANKGCASCLRTSPGQSPSGAFIGYGAFAQINQGGCVALSSPCNDSCARAIGAAADCRHHACEVEAGGTCDPSNGVSDEEIAKCFARAGSGPNCACSELFSTAQACYAKLDTSTQALCNAQSEADFLRIAKFMCGPCTN